MGEQFEPLMPDLIPAPADDERTGVTLDRRRAFPGASGVPLAILDAIPDSIVALDDDDVLVYMNAAAAERARLIGRDPLALLGQSFWESHPELIGTLFEVAVRDAARSRQERAAELASPVDGRHQTVRICPGEGCLVLFSSNVPQGEAGEERASHYQIEREAAIRAKNDFLTVVSHELLTPLNAIGGYAQLMQEGIGGPLTVEHRGYVQRIEQSQRHLRALIDDVLSAAKIESGELELHLERVPLVEALGEVEQMLEPQFRRKGLRYLRSPWPGELAVRADRERLRQILINLLGNAVKFTPAGDVRVVARAADRIVEITVHDTGPGISRDRLDEIFEPFSQVETHLARRAQGVGLGLFISRDLARAMGGELRAESTPGSGSAFTLELPRS